MNMLALIGRAITGAGTTSGKYDCKLRLVPKSIRTVDHGFLFEIKNNQFGLAGDLAITGRSSPFAITPPSREWEHELHGFAWLINMQESSDKDALKIARKLVSDWISHYPKGRNDTSMPRRIMSWLTSSGFLLDDAPEEFYYNMTTALMRQVYMLDSKLHQFRRNSPERLEALIAVMFAGVCLANQQWLLDKYRQVFFRELKSQIRIDGGHISGNPQIMLDLALDLMPLKQCFNVSKMSLPKEIMAVIACLPKNLAFLRLGAGDLVRFNGMGATRRDELATIMSYGEYFTNQDVTGSGTGYCRRDLNELAVVSDVSSRDLYAGPLSIEVGVGDVPVIVNCGTPDNQYRKYLKYSRQPRAHSTIAIEDASPLGYVSNIACKGFEGGFEAIHNGYHKKFGVMHRRRIKLLARGKELAGDDMLEQKGRAKAVAFAARFHLHPDVHADRLAGGNGCKLTLSDGSAWVFSAEGARFSFESSRFLACRGEPRESLCIRLSGRTRGVKTTIRWSLKAI